MSADGTATRGRLGKKQHLLAKLSEQVRDLSGRVSDTCRDAQGQVFWGKHDKNSIWLPCVVVSPQLFLHQDKDSSKPEDNIVDNMKSRDHLMLAKETLQSKRESVIVYWLGYGLLSKQALNNLVPFGESHKDPNDVLTKQNETFLQAAYAEAERFLKESREERTRVLTQLIQSETATVCDDEEQDGSVLSFGKRRKQSFSARVRQSKLDLQWKGGSDPFEPAWKDPISISHADKENGSKQLILKYITAETPASLPPSEVTFSHHQQHSTTRTKQRKRQPDDSEADDDEEEGEEYVPTASKPNRKKKSSSSVAKKTNPAGTKRKRADNKVSNVKKQKTDLTPLDRLKRYKAKIDVLLDTDKEGDKLLAIMQRLAEFDITTELLSQSSIGKSIATLRDHSNPKIKTFAKALRKIWVDHLQKKKAE